MIRDYLAYIEEAFTECDLHSGFMTKEHLKEYVNSKTRINKLEVLIQDDEKMSLTEIFNEFIEKGQWKGVGATMLNINTSKCFIN